MLTRELLDKMWPIDMKALESAIKRLRTEGPAVLQPDEAQAVLHVIYRYASEHPGEGRRD